MPEQISLKAAATAFMLAASVFGTVWGGFNAFQDIKTKNIEQDFRLDRTDRDRDRNTAAVKEQTVETQKLKEAVVKLTVTLENQSRKAEGKQTLEVVPTDYKVGD